MRTRTFDWTALTLIIIGAINWGLVGLFQFDLIASVFGGTGVWVSRIVYSLIGLSGIYALSLFGKVDDNDAVRRTSEDRIGL